MASDTNVLERSSTAASTPAPQCGSCERPVIRIQFMLNGHRAEVRTCGLCDSRVLLIDGAPVTREDLLDGMRPDHWTPPLPRPRTMGTEQLTKV